MYKYVVQSVQKTGDDAITVTLQPRSGQELLRFKPGQYAAIGFTVDGRKTPMRCFSMTSSPSDPQILQFGMKVSGKFTQTVASLNPGDQAEIAGPYGAMTVNPKRDKAVVMIAGGIGITPFMSIIRDAANTGSTLPIRLLYANRTPNAPFVDELVRLEQTHPSLWSLYFSESASNGIPGQRLAQGRITEELLRQVVGDHYASVTYMICGPRAMTRAVQKILKGWNVSPDHILVESFSQETSFAWPKFGTAPATTYALSAAGLLIATGIVMFSDLKKVSAKLSKTTTTQTPTTTTTPATTTPVQTAPTPEPTPVDTTPTSPPYTPPRGGAS